MNISIDNGQNQNFTASLGPKKARFKAARYALSINEGELYKSLKGKFRKLPALEISLSGRAHDFPTDCVVMRVNAKNKNLDVKRKDYYVNYETKHEGKALWDAIKALADTNSELHKKIFIG